MNPYTGHLVKSLDMVPEIKAIEYEPVPRELERAAQKKLTGKSEATVSLTSGGQAFPVGSREKKRAEGQEPDGQGVQEEKSGEVEYAGGGVKAGGHGTALRQMFGLYES